MSLIEKNYTFRRDLVSDGYDQALNSFAQEIPMTIHEYPSGMEVWSWQVPNKWECKQAYLENLAGERLIDQANHPLHVVSYSLPFNGIVSREELFEHLHVHPHLPNAIPFMFKYYRRDWGLCCSQNLKDTFTDDSYRIVIEIEETPGKLKVGEVIIPGEREESIILAAHLCHPLQTNDDLVGVVAGIEVMKRLQSMPKQKYTTRLLIFPETIGSVCFLSQNENLISTMYGGIFLEMVGNDAPLCLQQSLFNDNSFDRAVKTGFKSKHSKGYIGQMRTIIDNDERQFNAPGVRVPMLSLSRVENPHLEETRFYPYPEYHSNLDTPAIVTEERMEESVQTIMHMLFAANHDAKVINKFKGEIFCAKYGIWPDYRTNPQAHKHFFSIMDLCGGEFSISEIAILLNISFDDVWHVISLFLEHDLVSLGEVEK